jgi:hypothetical protein
MRDRHDRIWGKAVSIVISHGLDKHGLIPGRGRYF